MAMRLVKNRAQRIGFVDKLSAPGKHQTWEVCKYESCEDHNVGSVEKVGIEPDLKRVGPASYNLEYG